MIEVGGARLMKESSALRTRLKERINMAISSKGRFIAGRSS